ncbi:hypothetical protein DFH06DRAFT_207955 [Mycena polygramma]|nr:hypothetical protein DFH06DRAFT_207955 [Mycena polygramma]
MTVLRSSSLSLALRYGLLGGTCAARDFRDSQRTRSFSRSSRSPSVLLPLLLPLPDAPADFDSDRVRDEDGVDTGRGLPLAHAGRALLMLYLSLSGCGLTWFSRQLPPGSSTAYYSCRRHSCTHYSAIITHTPPHPPRRRPLPEHREYYLRPD